MIVTPSISPGDLIVPLELLNVFKKIPGKSAYEIWLDQGNVGTEEDFLNSLKGADGKSAYEIWLELGNTGTEEDFINSLIGPQGPVGPTGPQGPQGEPGTSAATPVQDNYLVNTTILANKSVLLSETPADPFKVELIVYGGIEQEPGVDFLVTGSTLSWDGLALELLLEEGNRFSVRYLPTVI